GAVAVTDSSGRIEASEFRANTAGRSGGGLRMEGGGLRISNSTFDSNVSSAEDGTAIFSSGGEHEVHHVTFVGVGLRPLVSGEGLALFNSVLQSASAPCSGMFPGEGVAHSPGPPCVEGATTLDEMGLQRVATGCGNLGAFVPEPSSPLRGAGVAAFCTESDQCGNARPAARCTLGAVEDN
ncbi:MAG: choice-of-anchor Q domain-containing protein, partial [Myxococcota bacterium]